ncbi:hypothetical protein ACT7C8_17535 [Bacillus cereus]
MNVKGCMESHYILLYHFLDFELCCDWVVLFSGKGRRDCTHFAVSLQLFSFVREAQGQLQTILYSIPFVSIGSMLYWQRKSFLQEKYEDASEYAVHGKGNLRG